MIPAMLIGWLAKQSGDVEININSPGGDGTVGIAMANAIAANDALDGRLSPRIEADRFFDFIIPADRLFDVSSIGRNHVV